MTLSLIGLVGGYALVGALLVFLCFYTHFHWLAKAGIVVLVSLFYSVNYFTIMSLLGWPTSQDLPRNFRLVAAQVYEPNKTTGAPGRIYMWVTSMKDRAGLSTPRSLEVPYATALHENLSRALIAMENGTPQMGEVSDAATGLVARTDRGQTPLDVARIDFFDLPTSLLPEK